MAKADDEVAPYYQNQAKHFIDMLHDKGYFNPDVKREEMQGVEDVLAFLWESHCNMSARCVELLRRSKERHENDRSPRRNHG